MVVSLLLLTRVVTSISLLGDFLTISTFCKYRVLRKSLSRRLIIDQTVADTIANLALLCLSSQQSFSCNIQGLLVVSGTLSVVNWGAVMSFILLKFSANQADTHNSPERYMPYFHGICWGLPLVCGSMTLFFGGYHPEVIHHQKVWCTFDNEIQRFLLFYLPLWTAILYICYATVATKWHLYKVFNLVSKVSPNPNAPIVKSSRTDPASTSNSTSNNNINNNNSTNSKKIIARSDSGTSGSSSVRRRQQGNSLRHESGRKLVKRLTYFPLVLLACFFLPTAIRIMLPFTDIPYTLVVIGSLTFRLHGLFTYLLFVSSSTVSSLYYRDLCSLLGRPVECVGTSSISRRGKSESWNNTIGGVKGVGEGDDEDEDDDGDDDGYYDYDEGGDDGREVIEQLEDAADTNTSRSFSPTPVRAWK